MYLLDIPVSQVKARIRAEFEKNRHVKDVRAVQMLVAKGHMELDEVRSLAHCSPFSALTRFSRLPAGRRSTFGSKRRT